MTIPGRVADIMTTDVLSFRPEDAVDDAARRLLERQVGGAPVVDADGRLVGLLEDDDLLVQESRLHLPTAVSILAPTSDARLTIITCWPFNVDTKRWIVTAVKI